VKWKRDESCEESGVKWSGSCEESGLEWSGREMRAVRRAE
jgi:hypothetical protein